MAFQQSAQYLLKERRKRVANSYLRGESQLAIAEREGVTQATISHDLRAIRAEWLKEMVLDYDEAKARELARIDKLELEAWCAWERSQQDMITRSVDKKNQRVVEPPPKVGPGEDNINRKINVKMVLVEKLEKEQVKWQSGDPRFLDIIKWCCEQRSKIFGLIKPDKTTDVNIVNVAPEFFERISGRSGVVDPLAEKMKRLMGSGTQAPLNEVESNEPVKP